MPYSKFTLEDVEQIFGLDEQKAKLFEDISLIPATDWLLETLQKTKLIPAKSEKSRSELLIMPILLAVAEKNKHLITIFSGENLEGDIQKDLNGECDYILSKSAKSFSLKAPILGLVEAKQNIVENSMGQCVAQMLGARLFNERKNNTIPILYGCVTNGDIWQFLRLKDKTIYIDVEKYYLDNPAQLLGVFQIIINQS